MLIIKLTIQIGSAMKKMLLCKSNVALQNAMLLRWPGRGLDFNRSAVKSRACRRAIFLDVSTVIAAFLPLRMVLAFRLNLPASP